MASSPLIFQAMPPPAARRRPAQFTLPSVLNVEKRLAECPLLADIVAKVFLGCRTKILRAADAFSARRPEGPYRFIQNRSRTSAVALKSDAAAEKSKNQLSRDFQGRSIFDFCNNIGTKRTCRCSRRMSAVEG
jgi:hypothetical protein